MREHPLDVCYCGVHREDHGDDEHRFGVCVTYKELLDVQL